MIFQGYSGFFLDCCNPLFDKGSLKRFEQAQPTNQGYWTPMEEKLN